MKMRSVLEDSFFKNIKNFGAVGDGVTDDTDVIQNALNLAKIEGSVNILFPPGRYKVTRKLIIYKNTYLKLSSSSVILRSHTASIMQNGVDGSMYKGYNGEGNIFIEGGVFDGNLINYNFECSGFSLSHAENIRLKGVTIKDIYAGHALDLSGTKNILIEDCSFIGYRDRPDQSRNYSEAIQIDIQTAGGFPAFGEHDNTVTKDVVVRNCYFGASGTQNTMSWGCAIGHHASVRDIFPNHIKILYNTFDGCTYRALRILKFKDVLIEGNLFKSCFGAINVAASSNDSQASESILINNNIIDGTIGNISPVSINGVERALTKNVQIKNNTFKNLNNAIGGAIYVNFCESMNISENFFFDTSRALWVRNSENITFKANNIDITSLEMVYAQSSKNFNCISNTVKETKRIGINLERIDRGVIRNNLIEKCGTETLNTRSGIFIGTESSNLKVMENIILKSSNSYGVQVTVTCSNIQLTNNDVDGITGKVLLPSEVGFDGIYITSPNGSMYKMTVNNSGQVSVTQV
ncbi:right-handed parallel beta-helix repeat-containing protein [Bacillus spongiae]|uniref:Right-handed parallel beta-helix repeat-containing protein n=1 Tax=Bacillus spongiae TaxID=2683610 RepID=A0ABU8HCM9_9BACI